MTEAELAQHLAQGLGHQGIIFGNGDQAARLPGLAMPVQAIWGEKDAVIPAVHAKAVANHHVLPGVGHMVHMEAASAVNALIEGFLVS